MPLKQWLLEKLKEDAEDWTYEQLDVTGMDVEQISASHVAAETAYLSVFVKSMRIVTIRKVTTKFYPVVHAFTSLPHYSGLAEFHVLTTPTKLEELDPANLDRVIFLDRRMLGPVPYRGGDFDINLALFSVKSAELAKPFISLLESISQQAGVSFLSVMLPFAQPLTKGIELLIGVQNGSILEIGVSDTQTQPTTGYYIIMRAPKGSVNFANVRLDKDCRLTDMNGQPIKKYPYVVFTIEATTKRDDWFSVPELAQAHKTLQEKVRGGKPAEIDDAFAVFKRTTLTSPDLLASDGKRVVAAVEAHLKDIGPKLTAGEKQEIPDLATVQI